MIPQKWTAYHDYPFFKRAEQSLRQIFSEQGKEFPKEFE